MSNAQDRGFFDPLEAPAPSPQQQSGSAPPVFKAVDVSGNMRDIKAMLGGLYHELIRHTDHALVIRAKSKHMPEGIGAREIFCTDCNHIVFGMVAV